MLFCSFQLFALEFSQEEQTWISEHPVIRLGIGELWAPFIFLKANGKHVGFDIDLINLINERTGLKVEIVPGKWNQMVQMAQNREIDGLAESAANEKRREFFNFSEPYLIQYYALATTPENVNTIQSEADLQGKTLALIKGNAWVRNLVKSLDNVKTVEADTDKEAFTLVLEGKADASFMTLGMFSVYRKTFFKNIAIAHIFNEEENKLELLYSIRNDWPELVTILDKALNDITQQEKDALSKKWFGFTADDFESQIWLQLTEAETDWLKEHPVIRIAPDPDFPPIEWFNKDKIYQGITADLMQLISSTLDIEFKVVQCNTWDEVLNKAKSREVDMLPAAAQTPKRAEYMLFSDPHLVFPGVIITTKDNQHLNNSKELYYKEVGIVSGYLWNEFIRKDHPQIKIVNVANITDGLRKVSTNDIDAFIVTLPIALHYIEQEGIPNLIIAGETEYETKLSIHTRKDWPLLNSIMNKTLKAIPVEKKKNIINKWISLKQKSFFYQKDFWIIVLTEE
jgi:ABC-type amino acid transport substrate-binding protein